MRCPAVEDIGGAKLVLTDALIAEALAAGNGQRRPTPEANGMRRRRPMAMAVSANRLELLQVADAVAREKAIDRQIVIAAMEEAIQKAARSRYGQRERHPRRDRPQDRRDQAAPR